MKDKANTRRKSCECKMCGGEVKVPIAALEEESDEEEINLFIDFG